jgi:hypothetical protein
MQRTKESVFPYSLSAVDCEDAAAEMQQMLQAVVTSVEPFGNALWRPEAGNVDKPLTTLVKNGKKGICRWNPFLQFGGNSFPQHICWMTFCALNPKLWLPS